MPEATSRSHPTSDASPRDRPRDPRRGGESRGRQIARFWASTLLLLLLLAAAARSADRTALKAAHWRTCRQLLAGPTPREWARRLAVPLAGLDLRCWDRGPDVLGSSLLIPEPFGLEHRIVWLTPEERDVLEVTLLHELLHFGHPDWPEAPIEREAWRLWRRWR